MQELHHNSVVERMALKSQQIYAVGNSGTDAVYNSRRLLL